jgi:hypothetical protein
LSDGQWRGDVRERAGAGKARARVRIEVGGRVVVQRRVIGGRLRGTGEWVRGIGDGNIRMAIVFRFAGSRLARLVRLVADEFVITI